MSDLEIKRSPLAVIMLTVFIDLIGFGIVIPVLPFYVSSERFNASPRMVGVLFASYSLMQLVFSPVLGRMSDRYGRRPVLFWSIIGTGIGFLILGGAQTLAMLFAGRILDGITGGNISTAHAYVADVTKPEERAKGMGLIGAAFGVGFILGPAIGGILTRYGMSAPFYFAAALAFLNALLLYFVLPESLTAERRQALEREHAQQPPASRFERLMQPQLLVVLLIYFLFVVAFSIMTTTFALYTMFRFNYDAQHNGYLFAFIGIIAATVQGVLIGKIVKRTGEVTLVRAGALIFTVGLTLLPFVAPERGGLAALLAVMATFAFGNSLATPSLNSLTSQSATERDQGAVLGLSQSASSLARVVGPLIGAYMIAAPNAARGMDDHSLRLTFWTAAFVTFLAFLVSLLLPRFRHATRADAASMSMNNVDDRLIKTTFGQGGD